MQLLLQSCQLLYYQEARLIPEIIPS